MRAPRLRRFLAFLPLLGAGACELDEVTLVSAEDVIVAEVYLNLAENPADNEILAFLHRTLGTVGSVDDLRAARVAVSPAGGSARYELAEAPLDDCVDSAPIRDPGACFALRDSTTVALEPGSLFELEIELADGQRILGATRVPGAFELNAIPDACRMPPDHVLAIEWSRSDEAWAYVSETSIQGLSVALEPEGIEVEEDPLYLVGLSISDADTAIAYPSEFGIFNRIDLDQDVALRLQQGLPAGVSAEVTITATDRNFVNWARGGNFNPSGQVRVPSLAGAGTGVFGSTVGRSFQVFVSETPVQGTADCPGVAPAR